jgi:CheY-like chemotaxis protein
MKMNQLKSILIVDDNHSDLEMYKDLLTKHTRARVISTKIPGHAEALAMKHLFDFVLMDVTMEYKGNQFGGLELYKALLSRYGDSSMLVYSQLINDELLKHYNYDFNFLEKGASSSKFIEDVVERMKALRKTQFCFVAMPFNRQYDLVYETIHKSVRHAGYECIRLDLQQFNASIMSELLRRLRSCKFVIFVSAGQSANVFFGVGYAVALEKEVLTVTDKLDNLPFDVRDRNAIAYGSDPKSCLNALVKKVKHLSTISGRL